MRIIALLAVAIALLMPVESPASDACTAVSNGTNQNITAFSTCRNVANASGATVCATTGSSDMWQHASLGFINAPPSGVTIGSCGVTCTGGWLDANGICWVTSALSGNCDTACTSNNGCHIGATQYWAASGCTDANCLAVLTGLGLSSGGVTSTAGINIGCSAITTTRRRGTITTTCAASLSNNTRACACKPTGSPCVTPWRQIVPHGQCVSAFTTDTADYCSGACMSCANYAQQRCCSNGVLSNSGDYTVCNDICTGGGACN